MTTKPSDHLQTVLCADDPSDGIWALLRTGWADEHLPELPGLSVEQDPVHRHKDVLSHTVIVTANVGPRPRIRLAALFHDIGKPATRRIGRRGASFHHHEAVGAKITTRRMRHLGFDDELTHDVARLVALSGRFHGYRSGWSDSAVRRYARDAGHLLGDLNELVRCDCTTRRPEKVRGLQRQVDDLEARIRDLAALDVERARRPPIDGNEIMTLLDIEPGPAIGQALAMLTQAARHDPDLDRESSIDLVRAWWTTARPE